MGAKKTKADARTQAEEDVERAISFGARVFMRAAARADKMLHDPSPEEPPMSARNVIQILKALGPQLKALQSLSTSIKTRQELDRSRIREMVTTVDLEDLGDF